MNAAEVIDIGRDAMVVTLKLGGPIMLIALVVGLAISLFQALTQIQEATLTFVPKVLTVLLVLLLFLPFMLHTLFDFTHLVIDRAIAGG